jgi:hypothetical protein
MAGWQPASAAEPEYDLRVLPGAGVEPLAATARHHHALTSH